MQKGAKGTRKLMTQAGCRGNTRAETDGLKQREITVKNGISKRRERRRKRKQYKPTPRSTLPDPKF